MNTGGPGDHWWTDLFSWGRPAFGEPVDGLLRDVVRYGGQQALDAEPWASRLSRAWSGSRSRPPADAARLARDLTVLRDRPRQEAVDSGWEVDRG